jgi:hypothetical protein
MRQRICYLWTAESLALNEGVVSYNSLTEIDVPLELAMLTTMCKILGFHGGDYEEWCLLGCYAVWLL